MSSLSSIVPTVPARSTMVDVALGWINTWDTPFSNAHSQADISHTIDHLFSIIIDLLNQLQCNSKDFFVPVILYSDRFISKHGIKHNQLFNLLLASTILTAKFWGESVLVRNKKIAALFKYRLEDLNIIERRFLTGIDFRFSLTKTEVNSFIFEATRRQSVTQITTLPPIFHSPQTQHSSSIIENTIHDITHKPSSKSSFSILRKQTSCTPLPSIPTKTSSLNLSAELSVVTCT
eukprot:TRINITY_DN4451_c0_g1_i2.p1 TRINITY_DN4451_c0_g1~~TRINITY_DN4451_c0_g1_i2.p1  ORF type:complete len:234 (-),score=23.83 TRINITY_DN4451_c0_g1_i2:103-804(-)